MKAYLQLSDGSIFRGSSFGFDTEALGEVVFCTGMVGYPESLTDPSYKGQILVMTWPLIGSYGVPEFLPGSRHFESDKIQVSGLIVSGYIEKFSHHTSAGSLGDWLKSEGVPGLEGIDTRELTRKLREAGTMPGRIITGTETADAGFDFDIGNPVSLVSPGKPFTLNPGGSPVIGLLDCGCKRSIMNALLDRGCRVEVLPFEYDLTEVKADGFLISNGPGDPAVLRGTIERIRTLLESDRNVPVSGICLGCQLIALAAGGSTWKLPYGHRSQNQPVAQTGLETCRITSQNHGFAIDPDSLPENWEVWMTNLNDGTVEGIRHRSRPISAVQFHPEGSPGPRDSIDFFDIFLAEVRGG
jgi:carbamoyl-phosphate synthase small subunit